MTYLNEYMSISDKDGTNDVVKINSMSKPEFSELEHKENSLQKEYDYAGGCRNEDFQDFRMTTHNSRYVIKQNVFLSTALIFRSCVY